MPCNMVYVRTYGKPKNVHTFRTDQNFLTIPWHFLTQIQKISLTLLEPKILWISKKKYIWTKHPSLVRLKCKIPWHFCKISFFPDTSQNSLTIPWPWKNCNFPNISLTCMNPVYAPGIIRCEGIKISVRSDWRKKKHQKKTKKNAYRQYGRVFKKINQKFNLGRCPSAHSLAQTSLF